MRLTEAVAFRHHISRAYVILLVLALLSGCSSRRPQTEHATRRSDSVAVTAASNTSTTAVSSSTTRQQRAATDRSRFTLPVEGAASKLSGEEDAQLRRGAARYWTVLPPSDQSTETTVEGRLNDGTIWLVSGRWSNDRAQICVVTDVFTETADGGTGGADGECHASRFNASGAGGNTNPYANWAGSAPLQATEVQFTASDGRRGRAFTYDAKSLGLQLYVGFLPCDVDLTEVTAYDANSHEIGRAPAEGGLCSKPPSGQ